MKTIVISVVVLGLLYILFVRWHRNWLNKQTPAGSWTATVDETCTTLVFEGGPNEGTYKQFTVSKSKTVREFGHWASHQNSLNMLIMATDVPEHPRFGIDSQYRLSYVAPDSICIDGPDRSNLTFKRTTEDLDFDSK